MIKNNEDKAISLVVTKDLKVTLKPDSNHEFLMSTKDVANGFGVTTVAIRSIKLDHKNEFIEGKHFVSNVAISNGDLRTTRSTGWSRGGILRLAFYIRGEQGRIFRDCIENVVMEKLMIFDGIAVYDNDGFKVYDSMGLREKFGYSTSTKSAYRMKRKYPQHFVLINNRWCCDEYLAKMMHLHYSVKQLRTKLEKSFPMTHYFVPKNQLSLPL